MNNNISYYNNRLLKLGITPEINVIDVWQLKLPVELGPPNEKGFRDNLLEKKTVPIFRQHPKGIEIVVYGLDSKLIQYRPEDNKWVKNWSIIRLEKPVVKADGSTMKYQMPSKSGSFPFFPPSIIAKYEKKEQIETLFLTEGYFKAFKGAMHGIDIVGIASITHMKSKASGALHEDILKLILACDVKKVVWLVDGDCLDLSSKGANENEHIDLYQRPSAFYSSITTFKQLLDDYHVDKYFFHVDTDAIYNQQNEEQKLPRDEFKGLDDILVNCPDKIAEIVDDIHSVSKPGVWFQKYNLNAGLNKIRNLFNLRNVTEFYLHHVQRYEWLKNKDFIFNGTQYRYNDEKGECEIMIPGNAKNYFRVGNDYYKWVERRNAHEQDETVFKGRMKSIIIDDHGKDFIKHIPKYEDFVNVPSHVNYQEVINNCFNVYSRLEYEPEQAACTEEDCPIIIGYFKHLFGLRKVPFTHPITKEKKVYENWQLGIDYVQLLYQQPIQKLPILCLVSKENNTGKSTFAHFLKVLFGTNCAIVGNQDLAGDFNAHWSTKLIVACDETKIDKHTVIEKVKSLSTATKITINAKGKDQSEIDCFIKFIFITNNEENFIYISTDDIRYWVNKVPVLTQENPDMLQNMIEEIPAFLSYLNNRKLLTERLNRMWFHPNILKTEALKKVVDNSSSTPKREILQKIRDMFFDFGVEKIMMTRKAIHEEFFRGKYEANYLEKILKDEIKVDMYHKNHPTEKDLFGQPIKVYSLKRHTYPKWGEIMKDGKKQIGRIDVTEVGRPYIFLREQFLTPEQIASIDAGAENKYLNDMDADQDEDNKPNPEFPVF